jgi:Holliday junction resolvase RusA-like endonuclease
MSDRYLYCLPWPPSVNKQYVNRKARVKAGPKAGKAYTARMRSAQLNDYRARVRVAVRVGHVAPPRLGGRLCIRILACPPGSYRTRDLDNLGKALLDSLRYAEVIEDDSLFDELTFYRGAAGGAGKMLVAITPFDVDEAIAAQREAGLHEQFPEDHLPF